MSAWIHELGSILGSLAYDARWYRRFLARARSERADMEPFVFAEDPTEHHRRCMSLLYCSRHAEDLESWAPHLAAAYLFADVPSELKAMLQIRLERDSFLWSCVKRSEDALGQRPVSSGSSARAWQTGTRLKVARKYGFMWRDFEFSSNFLLAATLWLIDVKTCRGVTPRDWYRDWLARQETAVDDDPAFSSSSNPFVREARCESLLFLVEGERRVGNDVSTLAFHLAAACNFASASAELTACMGHWLAQLSPELARETSYITRTQERIRSGDYEPLGFGSPPSDARLAGDLMKKFSLGTDYVRACALWGVLPESATSPFEPAWRSWSQSAAIDIDGSRRLRLSYPRNIALPMGLSKLQSLDSLHIHGTNALAKDLWDVSSLRKLQLELCKIESFPDEAENFKHLESLNLYSLGLKEIPPVVFRLPALRHFEFNTHCATEKAPPIPAAGPISKELRTLALTSNAMTTLPESIGRLRELRVLRLQGDFEALPEAIEKLSKLERLIVISSRLNGLPPGISSLRNLFVLRFDSGTVADLKVVAKMPWLEYLILPSGLPRAEVEALKETLSRTTVQALIENAAGWRKLDTDNDS